MRRILFLIIIALAASLQAQVTGLQGWNIFLDPGHSRQENQGVFGVSEAERNVRVALNLRDLLLSTTDIDTVYLSRTNDNQYVTLTQRTDMANRLGAAWFHSIHSDAGGPSANSTLLLWGQYRDGREKIPNGGKAMSDIMIKYLTDGLRTYTIRGSIGDCSFYGCTFNGPYLSVNRRSTMPSELSEAGFHTNPAQAQRFMNAEWKRLEAKTFYWSILEFHNLEKPFFGTCAGYILDIDTGVPVNGARVHLNGKTYVTDTWETVFKRYSNDPDELHNGFYYFEALPDSELQMIVEADSFYSDTLSVQIKDDFFTFRDVDLISQRAPMVVSTDPEEGAERVPAWDKLVIEFSRPLDKQLFVDSVRYSPHFTADYTWIEDDRKLVIKPDTLQYLTAYSITIPGTVTDRYGHAFDGNGDGIGGDDFVLNFATGPRDMEPPSLLSYLPERNAEGVDRRAIVSFVFDEPLLESSVADSLINYVTYRDREPVPGKVVYYPVGGFGVLSYFPSQQLDPATIYLVQVLPGLQDIHGNISTATRGFRFTTGETEYSYKEIDDFEAGINNWWMPQQSGTSTGFVTEKTGREAATTVVNLVTNSRTSMNLYFSWDKDADEWIVREYLGGGAPRNVQFSGEDVLQAYIFGDGSGHKFRFALDDRVPVSGATNHEVSPWYTLDWLGWKLISWNMATDGTGDWLGDGNLDGTLRMDSFQLTRGEQSDSLSGNIYIDDLRLARIIPASVQFSEKTELPSEYKLYPNFPNPFNPQTTITFTIPRAERVTLKIYNLNGRLVTTLIDQKMSAGRHAVRWSGMNQSRQMAANGVYLYTLEAGAFKETKKMTFIK
ncbi:T9SS type A sorting domain-containing protein [candidate division KSB1 bacterium]|nr:T9SS type A sorting domain-containing protein [candidate division KSB1 bacterium]